MVRAKPGRSDFLQFWHIRPAIAKAYRSGLVIGFEGPVFRQFDRVEFFKIRTRPEGMWYTKIRNALSMTFHRQLVACPLQQRAPVVKNPPVYFVIECRGILELRQPPIEVEEERATPSANWKSVN